jgi:hypothetical protein
LLLPFFASLRLCVRLLSFARTRNSELGTALKRLCVRLLSFALAEMLTR